MQERIASIRQRLASVPEDKVLASQQGRNDSICWECANCRPSKCMWVAELDPIWSKAVRENSSGQALGPYAYKVQECSFFEAEETAPGSRVRNGEVGGDGVMVNFP
jgi:hypothetical protein